MGWSWDKRHQTRRCIPPAQPGLVRIPRSNRDLGVEDSTRRSNVLVYGC